MDAKVVGNGAQMFKTMENYGLDPRHLKPYNKGGVTAGVPFVCLITTDAGASNFDAFDSTVGAPFKLHVIGIWVIALTVADGDTVTVKKVAADGTTVTTISDTVSLELFTDIAQWAGIIDDDQCEIPKGGDIRVTTASGAVAKVYVMCLVKS